jgi:hypothetical protein
MRRLRVQSLRPLGQDECIVYIAITSVKNLRKEKAHLCVFYDANNVLGNLMQKGLIASRLVLLILALKQNSVA